MRHCCRPLGHIDPARTEMLERLAACGAPLPEGARIDGPRDDMVWRVTDQRGIEVGIASPHSLRAILDAGPLLDLIIDVAANTWTVYPYSGVYSDT